MAVCVALDAEVIGEVVDPVVHFLAAEGLEDCAAHGHDDDVEVEEEDVCIPVGVCIRAY